MAALLRHCHTIYPFGILHCHIQALKNWQRTNIKIFRNTLFEIARITGNCENENGYHGTQITLEFILIVKYIFFYLI
jgi:hypothetical protein